MTEQTGGGIIPGSYNDAKVSLKGEDICVGQNPAMFIVLAVIALIIAAVLFFLAGKGEMSINGIVIPQAIAKVLSKGISIVFVLATLVCILQAMSPAMLILSPGKGRYTKTGGIVAKLAMRPEKSGTFADFDKLTLVRSPGNSQSGPPTDTWRLTLYLKNGTDFNMGSFSDETKARQLANGFAEKLKLPLT